MVAAAPDARDTTEPIDLMRYAPLALLLLAVVAVGGWLLFGGDDGGDSDRSGAASATQTTAALANATATSARATQQPGAGGAAVTSTATSDTSGTDAGTGATTATETGAGDDTGTDTGDDTGDDTGTIVDPNDVPIIEVLSQEGQTLADIATEWGLAVRTLVWANQHVNDPTAVLEPDTSVVIPPVDGVVHYVSEGETLESISQAYGVAVWEIVSVIQNGVTADSYLEPGQALTIPGAILFSRGSIATYTVAEGDDLYLIADFYGLHPATIAYANDLPDTYLIYPGQVLVIPPTDGILVYAGEGDTVELIAMIYGVEPDLIRSLPFNELWGDAQPAPGQPVMIPGLELLQGAVGKGGAAGEPAVDPFASAAADTVPAATGTFIWPTIGAVTQWFEPGVHYGLDIAAAAWTPVYAADGGVVTFAGWNDYGLGYAVAIDHGNGFVTWYGHLVEPPAVAAGQQVAQGDWLGPMGSTGKSTGPHLHFVILEDGVYQDPWAYLP
jgi:murein DD-endopeptidase MepM/ murein hydrolase activator NlpD